MIVATIALSLPEPVSMLLVVITTMLVMMLAGIPAEISAVMVMMLPSPTNTCDDSNIM